MRRGGGEEGCAVEPGMEGSPETLKGALPRQAGTPHEASNIHSCYQLSGGGSVVRCRCLWGGRQPRGHSPSREGTGRRESSHRANCEAHRSLTSHLSLPGRKFDGVSPVYVCVAVSPCVLRFDGQRKVLQSPHSTRRRPRNSFPFPPSLLPSTPHRKNTTYKR